MVRIGLVISRSYKCKIVDKPLASYNNWQKPIEIRSSEWIRWPKNWKTWNFIPLNHRHNIHVKLHKLQLLWDVEQNRGKSTKQKPTFAESGKVVNNSWKSMEKSGISQYLKNTKTQKSDDCWPSKFQTLIKKLVLKPLHCSILFLITEKTKTISLTSCL